jgi:hypothetical protein
MSGLPQLTGFGENADNIRENNFSLQYYLMKNKHGREVYIAPHLVVEKLKMGFTHTDSILYTGDMSKRVHAGEKVDPALMMAKAMEKLVESNEDTKKLVEEVTEVKRRRRTTKLEEVVVEA